MPTYLDGFSGRFKVPVIDIRNPGLASVEILDLHLVLTVQLGEFGFDIGCHERDDRFRGLWRDESIETKFSRSRTRSIDGTPSFTWYRGYAPKAKLASHFGRDDSLGARFGESALDTVKGERRVTHAAHDYSLFVI